MIHELFWTKHSIGQTIFFSYQSKFNFLIQFFRMPLFVAKYIFHYSTLSTWCLYILFQYQVSTSRYSKYTHWYKTPSMKLAFFIGKTIVNDKIHSYNDYKKYICVKCYHCNIRVLWLNNLTSVALYGLTYVLILNNHTCKIYLINTILTHMFLI